jgi:DNA-3-methyladenine glycosylase
MLCLKSGPQPLRRDALPGDTVAMARFLIGKIIMRTFADGMAAARITETEAYLTHDEASHAFKGMTARNRVMFGPPGYAYVYLAYGVSYMLNVSSAPEGVGEGVLIRAAEPLLGLDIMRRYRGEVPPRDLLRGPGRLCKALDIDLRYNGTDLCAGDELWIASDRQDVSDIGVSVRIGIKKDAHRPLRFFALGNSYVSGRASLNRRG